MYKKLLENGGQNRHATSKPNLIHVHDKTISQSACDTGCKILTPPSTPVTSNKPGTVTTLTEYPLRKEDVAREVQVNRNKKGNPKTEMLPPPPPLIRDKSGTLFYVGRQIGRGGYSRCYVASDNKGRTFAAKTMILPATAPESSVNRIEREASIHERLHHPFIVKFQQMIQDKNTIFFVLDYCPNQTLSELVTKRGRLMEIDTCKMLIPICNALHYLHNQLIHHGDLKLSNIFLDRNMSPKIGDFGFSKQLKSPKFTRNSLCGTPAYMAPEIVQIPCRFGLPADIWSLGVITYALLYGVTPFDAQSVDAVYARIKGHDLKFPEISPIISSQGIKAMRSMLAWNPDLRPTSRDLMRLLWIRNQLEAHYNSGVIPETGLKFEIFYNEPAIDSKRNSKQGFTHMCKSAYMKIATVKKLQKLKNVSGIPCQSHGVFS